MLAAHVALKAQRGRMEGGREGGEERGGALMHQDLFYSRGFHSTTTDGLRGKPLGTRCDALKTSMYSSVNIKTQPKSYICIRDFLVIWLLSHLDLK